MANNLTNVFQSLVVPAATACMETARYKNVLLDSVFTEFSGDGGGIGQVLQINIPIVNESDVNSIGSGPVSLTDTNHNPFTVTIDTKYSDAKRIQSFDKIRTPLDFQTLYLGAMIESVLRKTNRRVATEFNPAAGVGILSVNSAVAGAVANSYARADLASAWTTLVNKGCPMGPLDTAFITNPTPWGKIVSDTTSAQWVTQYVVGEEQARLGQQNAKMLPQFDMRMDYDQTMPSTAAPKFIGCAFHRWAVGMKFIAEQTPDTGGYVKEMFIYPRKNVPVRIQMWYDPTQQGYVLHVSTSFGIATIRPEFAVQVLAG